MSDIIALVGPQQVGKTTTASSLQEHHGFRRMSFAEPLYRMVAALLDISAEEARELPKNDPLPQLEGQTLRYTLQKLGTEWGRDTIGQDIWVNACLRRSLWLRDRGINVVIDDCRFLNEYEALKEVGAKFVRLTREDMPEQVNPDHGSEADWPSFEVDARVLNPSDGVRHWRKLAGVAVLAALEVRTKE